MHEPSGGRRAALDGNLSMVRTLCDAGANPLAESQVGPPPAGLLVHSGLV